MTKLENNRMGAVLIKAKFPSKCAAGCLFHQVKQNEEAIYIPSQKVVYHPTCAPKEATYPIHKCLECGNGNNTHTLSCKTGKK